MVVVVMVGVMMVVLLIVVRVVRVIWFLLKNWVMEVVLGGMGGLKMGWMLGSGCDFGVMVL